MKCEMCGANITFLLADTFDRDGSDCYLEYPAVECEKNAVYIETPTCWVGDELSEEEQIETILCPICKKFPFKNQEIQTYRIIRVVCFKTVEGDERNCSTTL